MEYSLGFPHFRYFMVLETNRALELRSWNLLWIKKNTTNILHYTPFPSVYTFFTNLGHPASKITYQNHKVWGKWSKTQRTKVQDGFHPTLVRQAVPFKLQKQTFKNKFNIYLQNTDIVNGANTEWSFTGFPNTRIRRYLNYQARDFR